MTWTIEQVGGADQERIKQLLTERGGPTEDLVGAWHESFLVARENSAVVGVVGLEIHGKAALVRSLATSPGHCGQGIASALLETAEERARAVGTRSIYGLTVTAEVFFTKRGYESIDRLSAPDAIRATAEFRTLCPETAVCLRKGLGQLDRLGPLGEVNSVTLASRHGVLRRWPDLVSHSGSVQSVVLAE